jgi:hypothetical protein
MHVVADADDLGTGVVGAGPDAPPQRGRGDPHSFFARRSDTSMTGRWSRTSVHPKARPATIGVCMVSKRPGRDGLHLPVAGGAVGDRPTVDVRHQRDHAAVAVEREAVVRRHEPR